MRARLKVLTKFIIATCLTGLLQYGLLDFYFDVFQPDLDPDSRKYAAIFILMFFSVVVLVNAANLFLELYFKMSFVAFAIACYFFVGLLVGWYLGVVGFGMFNALIASITHALGHWVFTKGPWSSSPYP